MSLKIQMVEFQNLCLNEYQAVGDGTGCFNFEHFIHLFFFRNRNQIIRMFLFNERKCQIKTYMK